MVYTWFFGYGLLINCAIAAAGALLAEGAVLRLRSRGTRHALRDGSALVTAALLSFAIPPLAMRRSTSNFPSIVPLGIAKGVSSSCRPLAISSQLVKLPAHLSGTLSRAACVGRVRSHARQ